MNFEEALAEYGRLRQAYNSGQLGAQDFAQRVQQIQVRDASGNYWAIDGSTGGWLRYDGSNWVPGQPPLPQGGGMAPTQLGGFDQPSSGSGFGGSQQPQGMGYNPGQGGGFGQQPSGGFGQPQGGFGQPPQGSGGFGQPPQGGMGYAPGAQPGYQPQAVQPAKRGGRRGLVIGAAIAGVLLLFCVVGVIAVAASGRLGGTTGITDVATAKDKDSKNQPVNKTSDFAVGDQVYITYKANSVKKDQFVDLKMTRDGSAVQLQDTKVTFTENKSYVGYYSYKPSAKGTYKVDLFFNGEATPSQTVTFTVK